MYYFYYNKDTGEFEMRTKKPYAFTDSPCIQKPKDFKYGDYRVNLVTLEVEPKT